VFSFLLTSDGTFFFPPNFLLPYSGSLCELGHKSTFHLAFRLFLIKERLYFGRDWKALHYPEIPHLSLLPRSFSILLTP